MNRSCFLFFLTLTINLSCPTSKSYGQSDYLNYHAEIIRCEQIIAELKYGEAISCLDDLFNQFDFVFLRDIKMATQLSAIECDIQSGFEFIRLGILNGWTLKQIKRVKNFKVFESDPNWKILLSEYDSLHIQSSKRLNESLKNQVHALFKRDQKMAFGALLRIGQKSKVFYAENKFAPHSEIQLRLLNEFLNAYGYPGEQLIGNDMWVSVILSHHNSISSDYNSSDTLYSLIRPKLINAIKNGEMSPYEFAMIEDWRTAVSTEHDLTSFGFLGTIPNETVLEVVNRNRSEFGLRSVELRNVLIDLEKSSGMNLYLPKGWQREKIMIVEQHLD